MAVDKEAGIGQLTGMVVQKLRGAAGALRNPVPALGKAKSLFSGTAPAVPAVTEAAGAVKPMTFRKRRDYLMRRQGMVRGAAYGALPAAAAGYYAGKPARPEPYYAQADEQADAILKLAAYGAEQLEKKAGILDSVREGLGVIGNNAAKVISPATVGGAGLLGLLSARRSLINDAQVSHDNAEEIAQLRDTLRDPGFASLPPEQQKAVMDRVGELGYSDTGDDLRGSMTAGALAGGLAGAFDPHVPVDDYITAAFARSRQLGASRHNLSQIPQLVMPKAPLGRRLGAALGGALGLGALVGGSSLIGELFGRQNDSAISKLRTTALGADYDDAEQDPENRQADEQADAILKLAAYGAAQLEKRAASCSDEQVDKQVDKQADAVLKLAAYGAEQLEKRAGGFTEALDGFVGLPGALTAGLGALYGAAKAPGYDRQVDQEHAEEIAQLGPVLNDPTFIALPEEQRQEILRQTGAVTRLSTLRAALSAGAAGAAGGAVIGGATAGGDWKRRVMGTLGGALGGAAFGGGGAGLGALLSDSNRSATSRLREDADRARRTANVWYNSDR